MENKSSGLGIASFVLSLIGAVFFGIGIIVAVSINVNDPLAHDDAYMFATLILMFGCALAVISVGLGWAACCKHASTKTLPIIGLSFSGTILLLMVTLMIIGNATS
jgi:hypothetical protein